MTTTVMNMVLAVSGDRIASGLAIADEFCKLVPTTRITFAGPSDARLERHVISRGFDYRRVGRKEGRASTAWSFASRWTADRAAKKLLNELDSPVVVGLGGEASLSLSKAAVSVGAPLVLHEQHVEPSYSTRRFASRASLICLAFEDTRELLDASCPMRVTGTPVPAEYSSSLRHAEGWPRTKRLVVLGNGNGHESLNLQLPRALQKVREQLQDWQVVHETGATDLRDVRNSYKKYGLNVITTPRVTNLPATLACADLVISRASGALLASIAAAGAPSIVVPPVGDDAPFRDAEVFHSAGACRVVDDDGAWMGDHLAHELAALLVNDEQRQQLSQSIQEQSRADAGWKVATMIRDLAIAVGIPLAA